MKKPTTTLDAELRRKAERKASQLGKSAAVPKSHAESLRLVHELQVHQIELEMQNEELRKAQDEAEQGRQRYVDLYDFAPVGYLSFNPDGSIRQANLTGSRLLGVDRSSLVNRQFDDFIAEADRPAFHTFMEQSLVGDARYSCEVSIPRQGQDPLFLHVEGRGSEGGKECHAAVLDITESKRALALRESEKRFRTLVESVTDYIYTVRMKDGAVVDTVHGPGCLNVTGYACKEYQANPHLWLAMVVDEDRPAVVNMTRQLMEGKPHEPLEHRIIHKDGSIRWIVHTAVPRYDDQGRLTGYDGLIHNITERKRMEGELLQARKLEAIGRLAGGVAHDFRNQLTVIKGFTELLLRMPLAEGDALDMLKEIFKAAERSELLTSQLLSFSRKDMLRKEEFDLTDRVGDICETLPHILGPDVRLSFVPSHRRCLVSLDPGLLRQALCNLVSNARYAMPKGGELKIETRMAAADDDVAHRHPDVKGEAFAVLEVADNGLGMDARAVSNLFEPFFTTKPVGDGTGLGLAMVYGFIKQSGGAVEVDSQPGQGTTIRLYFPLAS